jgi:hypothetical protein
VTAALMMAQQAAAEVETAGGPAQSYYTTWTTLPSSSSSVKSVRFGQQQALQQQQQQQQQQQLSKPNVEPERPGQEKDALAEATIGLEIAANLALAFARDVRRKKLAVDQSSQVHAGPGPATAFISPSSQCIVVCLPTGAIDAFDDGLASSPHSARRRCHRRSGDSSDDGPPTGGDAVGILSAVTIC